MPAAAQTRALDREAEAHAAALEELQQLRDWKETAAAELNDLAEQVDQASTFEAMVETLTDKNLALGERVADLAATVTDLENAVALGEEMEQQQAEEIRALQVCQCRGAVHACCLRLCSFPVSIGLLQAQHWISGGQLSSRKGARRSSAATL